jgi:hypothetical protein
LRCLAWFNEEVIGVVGRSGAVIAAEYRSTNGSGAGLGVVVRVGILLAALGTSSWKRDFGAVVDWLTGRVIEDVSAGALEFQVFDRRRTLVATLGSV